MFSSGDHPEIKVSSKKNKRSKRKTECSVLRSKTGCGCCGSQNVAEQGVVYCTECGAEAEYLTQGSFWVRKSVEERLCGCGDAFWHHRTISVGKCLDCGAVSSDALCPNHGNGRGHRCWKHWSGSVYCKSCGYRKQ